LPSSKLPYRKMRRISLSAYHSYVKGHDSVTVDNVRIPLVKEWNITELGPTDFKPEAWTVWSFEDRGDWATHQGNFRGNWSPYVPRNLIDHYTKEGDTVCDPMMGSGTTLVECKLMGRRAIGVDINKDAAMLALNRLDFKASSEKPRIEIYVGDARRLDAIGNGTIGLVATHPPYWRLIPYTKAKKGDLSALKLRDFILQMGEVANECFRILHANGHCAILIGDTRRHQHYVPINVGVLGKFLEAGFVLKEDIIKLQHKTKTTREKWKAGRYDFYKIAHEHLYVFRKPSSQEEANTFRYSRKWW